MDNKSLGKSRRLTPSNLPRYGIRDRPPGGMMIILAIQHVLGMFGATVLVPILVNQAAGAMVLAISVALFTSGMGTLIYQVCTKGQSPVYLGSSFAFIAPITAAYLSHGMGGAMTGVVVVGLIYTVVAIIVDKAGTKWIDRVLPPVVTGPMLMIIGFGLAPSAVSQMGIDGSSEMNWLSFSAAVVTLAVALLFMVGFRKVLNGFLNTIPFLLAIVVGYVYSIVIGLVDFTPVAEAAWFALPEFKVIGLHWQFDLGAVWTVAPLALATMSEHIGDHKAVSTITGVNLLKKPGLARTLLGDGLATSAAALLGGPANTSYGENAAIIGMTKVASVYVIRLAAVFAICLSMIGKFTAMISTIPSPVLGGVSLLLYGFIGLNGAKDIIQAHLNYNYPRNIAVSAIMLSLGLGGAIIPLMNGNISVSFSGMSLAAITGVVLNLIIPKDEDEVLEKINRRRDELLLEAIKGDEQLLASAEALIDNEVA